MKRILQRYKDLQDIIAIMGIDELSEADKQIVGRARRIELFLSQPNFVAERFTGLEGRYVTLDESVDSLSQMLEGRHDNLPEQAFYMIGGVEEAVKKAETLRVN